MLYDIPAQAIPAPPTEGVELVFWMIGLLFFAIVVMLILSQRSQRESVRTQGAEIRKLRSDMAEQADRHEREIADQRAQYNGEIDALKREHERLDEARDKEVKRVNGELQKVQRQLERASDREQSLTTTIESQGNIIARNDELMREEIRRSASLSERVLALENELRGKSDEYRKEVRDLLRQRDDLQTALQHARNQMELQLKACEKNVADLTKKINDIEASYAEDLERLRKENSRLVGLLKEADGNADKDDSAPKDVADST